MQIKTKPVSNETNFVASCLLIAYHGAMRIEDNWLFASCRITAADATVVTLRRGQTATDCLEGMPQVALVLDGAVEACTRSESGAGLVVNRLEAGSLFGVSNLFLTDGLPTTLTGLAKTRLALVPKRLVVERLTHDMDAMVGYARFCNRKLLFLLGRITALSPSSAGGRLAWYLITHEKDGVATLANKEETARALGLGRASLFRTLKEFETAGLIVKRDRKTYAVDTAALRNSMEEHT